LTGLALAAAVALITPLETPASLACFEAEVPAADPAAALTLMADRITLDGAMVDAREVTLAGCACAGQPWRVQANHLVGERDALARVDWPVLYWGPVPVAAAPVWWVPLGARVPGLLLPRARLRSDGALAVEQPIFLPLGRAADVTPALGVDSARGLLGGVTTRWRGPQSAERIETLEVRGERRGATVAGDASIAVGEATLAARGETALGRSQSVYALLPHTVTTQPRLAAEVAVTRATAAHQAALGVTRVVPSVGGSPQTQERHLVQAAASATTRAVSGHGRLEAALLADAEGTHRAAQLTGTFARPTRLGLMRWTPTAASQVAGDERAAMRVSANGHLVGEVSAVSPPGHLRHRLTAFVGGNASAQSERPPRDPEPWRRTASPTQAFVGLAQRLAAARSDAAVDLDVWWAGQATQPPERGLGGQVHVSTAGATVSVLGGLNAAHARARATWQAIDVGASYLWSREAAARPETLDPRQVAPWQAERGLALTGGALELGVTQHLWHARFSMVADTLIEGARLEAHSASVTWNALCECLSIGAAVEHSRGLAAPDVRLSLSGRL